MTTSDVSIDVDVGVLKEQMKSLTSLCGKMDTVIDRLMDNHAKNTVDIYNDMEKRRQESQADIKELHSRITTVDRNLSDKIELTERRIMEEIKNLKREIVSHNQKEDSELKRILEWKWMVMGAVGLFVWIISNFDKVSAIFH
jgi:chromosome segregation ATPase